MGLSYLQRIDTPAERPVPLLSGEKHPPNARPFRSLQGTCRDLPHCRPALSGAPRGCAIRCLRRAANDEFGYVVFSTVTTLLRAGPAHRNPQETAASRKFVSGSTGARLE